MSSLLLSLTTLLVVVQSSQTSPLISLLAGPISDSVCWARCQDLPSPPSQEQCYQVCKFRQKHPDTDLCRLPHLCVDLGCQVACHDDHQPGQVLIDSFTRRGCRLSWSISSRQHTNVVFVLAGRDHAGDMWSLIQANLTEPSLELSSEFGMKYHTVAIVAVSSSQVEDVLKVKIPKQLDCPAGLGGEQTLVAGISDSDLMIVIVLSLLVTVLLLVLSVILRHKRNRRPELTLPQLSCEASPASKTEVAVEKTKVCGDVGMEEGRGGRAVGNLYLPFPSNIPLRTVEEEEEEYSYISYDFEH